MFQYARRNGAAASGTGEARSERVTHQPTNTAAH